MESNVVTATINLPDGRTITVETGKLAKQADGAALVKMGNTMLLATVCSNAEPSKNLDYFPLSVDYREKYASTGRFPGGFFKREARPSDHEILICRLVDRCLRPLFPDDYMAETQVIINLISAGKDDMPDALACLAASAALAVSDIPFKGPVSEVRVARVNGNMVINPSQTDLKNADLDLIVGATEKNITMVEGGLKEIPEKDMIEALKYAHEAIKDQCRVINELAGNVEKSKIKRSYSHIENDQQLKDQMYSRLTSKVEEVIKAAVKSKQDRKKALDKILEEYISTLSPEDLETKPGMIKRYFEDIKYDVSREQLLATSVRMDGRKTDEIRNISIEIDLLPGTHGSSLFTRGETQALASVTLGTKLDAQMIDGALIQRDETFLLHYNFPPFSTGEVKPMRGTGRREVGHGNLALRALRSMIPPQPENPYTIRIVSDILESNGSSSMATVCASSAALMDAGVKIPRHVSGIAMGLITGSGGRYAILSDILGDEDHLGDMDFKVCGTERGITACQMDIKIDGLSFEVMAEALEQARIGRLTILTHLYTAIEQPRDDYKPHAPRIVQLQIPKDTIGALIGPGGKVIQKLQEETGVTINIEEENGVGIVDVSSENKESIVAAVARIKAITAVPELNKTYKGKVKSLKEFGAFVEFLPGKEGLLHISEVAWDHVPSMEDVLREGDELEVKLIEIDPTGRFRLSRKALIPDDGVRTERPYQPRSHSHSGHSRDSRGNGHSSHRRYDRPHSNSGNDDNRRRPSRYPRSRD